MKHGQEDRRKGALKRLHTQFEKGTKPSKESGDNIPLTQEDKNRIVKEINVLKTRI